MAAEFNADQAVWDCARILRIPGFRNCKYEARHYVREVPGERSDGVLTPADFPVFETTGRPTAVFKKAVSAGGSQSERDWAFALRKLEDGMPPAEVQARIAVYRMGTKARPEYYAHRRARPAKGGHDKGYRLIVRHKN
jgi:hypothetical protein